ncbi:MAG: hypothetical protein JWN23_2181 [Rhodocyclales bacterium]|nr:hypothetical protein [Rhodocyclales bacterium]
MLSKSLIATCVLLLVGCATRGDPWICNDYLSSTNCVGGAYLPGGHRGIDFGADAGTEVISATYGTVVRINPNPCSGYDIFVATDMVGRYKDVVRPVYVAYAHFKPIVIVSQKVKPGDLLGHIIPLLHTSCYGSREHVHYELRVNNEPGHDIDPHQFWADGPGKVTCFREGMVVPPGKAVAPIRCRAFPPTNASESPRPAP